MAQSINPVNGSVSTARIEAWAAAGFLADLLPIIPHDATLSPASNVHPDNRGKVPGLLGDAGWTGFPGWTRIVADEGRIVRWAEWERDHGAGTGLHGRRFPGVDIDVTDEAASAALADLAETVLGPAPTRTGRAPKRLLPYRLADGEEPVRKRRVAFTLPGSEATHAVEILGEGQHYVVEGTHPSGAVYSWDRSPADTGPDALSPITAERIDAFLEEVAKAVEAMGGTVVEAHSGGAGGAGRTRPYEPSDPELIREALTAMGNDLDRPSWITMCAAIKCALGGDEAHYGIYEEWCLLHPDNTPKYVRDRWDSLNPPFAVGGMYVFEKARDAGWSGWSKVSGLAAIPGAVTPTATEDVWDPGFAADTPAYMRDWVYVSGQKRFFEERTERLLDETDFARWMATPDAPPRSVKNPASTYFVSPLRRLADGLTFMPGRGLYPVEKGQRLVNLWRPSPVEIAARARAATIADADVQPWLDHAAALIPDVRARGIIFDWMAYVLQHPTEKPNWALFLGGAQGVGKDTLFQPLIAAVGERYTSQPGSEEVSGTYTDWISDRRLVVVQEMRNFEGKATMDKLKKYVACPPLTVPVVKKFVPRYEIPNIACFLFMSNFRDALSLEESDRRYFVYWSPTLPSAFGDGYFAGIYSWYDNGGAEAVAAWLLARNVATFDAKGRAPETADRRAMIDASRPAWEQDLAAAIKAGGAPFDRDLVTTADVERWATQRQRRGGPSSRHAIGTALVRAGAVALTEIDLRPNDGRVTAYAIRNAPAYEGLSAKELRIAYAPGYASGRPDPSRAGAEQSDRLAELIEKNPEFFTPACADTGTVSGASALTPIPTACTTEA